MLSGNINHLDLIPYLPSKAAKFIAETKILLEQSAADGKHELSEEGVFLILVSVDTMPIDKCRPEIHEKYIDVQLLLSGEESIGYGHQTVIELCEDLLAERDVAFCNTVVEEKVVSLNQGDFAMFFPGEIHRPLLATQQPMMIRKAIIKIPLALI